MLAPQHNPAAFRRQRAERLNQLRIKALKEADKIKSDTRKCYIAYSPPQIRMAHPMRSCMGLGPVMPVFRGRKCSPSQ